MLRATSRLEPDIAMGGDLGPQREAERFEDAALGELTGSLRPDEGVERRVLEAPQRPEGSIIDSVEAVAERDTEEVGLDPADRSCASTFTGLPAVVGWTGHEVRRGTVVYLIGTSEL